MNLISIVCNCSKWKSQWLFVVFWSRTDDYSTVKKLAKTSWPNVNIFSFKQFSQFPTLNYWLNMIHLKFISTQFTMNDFYFFWKINEFYIFNHSQFMQINKSKLNPRKKHYEHEKFSTVSISSFCTILLLL